MKTLRFLCVLLFLNTVTNVARGEDTFPAQRSLLLQQQNFDLSDEQVVGVILAQPVQRVFLPYLNAGHTLAPTSSTVFKANPLYQNQDTALKKFIQQAHAKNIQVYAYLDCLHWTPAFAKDDLLRKFPELAEREDDGDFGQSSNGKYASPFNAQVQAQLLEVVKEAARADLDGLLLECRLPLGKPLLAFSDAARQASVAATGIEPIQVDFSNPDTSSSTAKWITWRLQAVSSLVGRLSATFKAQNPQGKVSVVGYARWPRLKLGKQNTMLENWPAWSQAGSVDEVLLQDNWDAVAPDTFTTAQTQLQGAPRAVGTAALVTAAQIATDLDLQRTTQVLATNTSVVLAISHPDELERTTRFWAALAAPSAITTAPAIASAVALPVAIGQNAPDFALVDMNGRTLRLNDFRGQKNVLLTFFPKAFTSGCEQHLESLQAHRAEFDAANTQIIAVSVDAAELQRSFADTLGLSFTMLPDMQHHVVSLYGGFNENSELSKRQSIFIDKSGIVRLIDHNVQPATHGADILAAMKNLPLP